MPGPDLDPPVVFANSGVQIICVPLRPEVRLTTSQSGSGWQYCRCRGLDKTTRQETIITYGYLQWQVLGKRLFLAIDTTIGSDEGDPLYFAKGASLSGDVCKSLTGLCGADGSPLAGLPPLEFVVRPALAEGGEAREVHLVVDFGNSRTGALIVEFRGDTMQEPMMTPLQLVNRLQLDAWDDQGHWSARNGTTWFSSKTHWCTPPYRDAPELETVHYQERRVRGPWFGEKVEYVPVTARQKPLTFEEISGVRLGREADDLSGVMNAPGEIRTGVSSPKRYLWARDAGWLEGANWHMADPFDRFDARQHATPLKGPFIRFFPEDDSVDDPTPRFDWAPASPRHAPRLLMVGALYELLCQAFTYVNSPAYRTMTGDAGRMRVITSLCLTFPSGMIGAERNQLEAQALKAIRVFMQTVARHQATEPQLKLSIDEASAVHLTYLWSEARKLGRKPGFWFSVMGRKPATPAVVATETPPSPANPAAGPRFLSRPPRAPRSANAGRNEAAPVGPEVRIACIDIGGGTSDLMIARYVCDTQVGGDQIEGETLHRDGISVAGDQLVKRLLERVIVPHFANVVGIELQDVHTLFGKEVPANRQFRRQRIHWINRLFVPLAQAYLDNAVDEVDAKISHTDPDIVAPDVVQALQDTINSLWKAGKYNVKQALNLWYDRDEFEAVVDEVFGELLFDFCESIVEHRADVVLLAGLPTKLPYIRSLVETYLPLAKSRIVPMYGRYAGTWYPYQNPDNLNPGVVVDPKSTVVVGAAIEFAARHGMIDQFKFRMSDRAAKASFYWGVMTESRIDAEKVLFSRIPEGEDAGRVERREIDVNSQSLLIGRKRRPRGDAQATPVYLLRVVRGPKLGEIDLHVAFERRRSPEGDEEISLEEVAGTVDGQPAVLGDNVHFEWRTLADERYYLDTGGLDKIELR